MTGCDSGLWILYKYLYFEILKYLENYNITM